MEVGETLVTVEFLEQGESTELVLTHERLPHAEAVEGHRQGWTACMEVLSNYIEAN